MPLKRGLWLSLLEGSGEATPVACDVAERRDGTWVLEAMIPPQVYPVEFVSARLRLDGHFLGQLKFAEPVVTVTHEPMDLRLEFPVDQAALENARLPAAAGSGNGSRRGSGSGR